MSLRYKITVIVLARTFLQPSLINSVVSKKQKETKQQTKNNYINNNNDKKLVNSANGYKFRQRWLLRWLKLKLQVKYSWSSHSKVSGLVFIHLHAPPTTMHYLQTIKVSDFKICSTESLIVSFRKTLFENKQQQNNNKKHVNLSHCWMLLELHSQTISWQLFPVFDTPGIVSCCYWLLCSTLLGFIVCRTTDAKLFIS